ncbi:MAG: DinB family protein, partial [Bryobacteraceae bacterium]
MKTFAVALAAGLLTVGPLAAQNALVADLKALHDLTKGNILKAADKMPEEHYSFKPTPDVRSFGQLIGHIADAQYGLCGRAGGLKPPEGGIEKTKTSKADLVAALKDAIAACDGVYASLDDAKASERIKFFGGERSKLSVLSFNTTHNYEHYGNIVTYMR